MATDTAPVTAVTEAPAPVAIPTPPASTQQIEMGSGRRTMAAAYRKGKPASAEIATSLDARPSVAVQSAVETPTPPPTPAISESAPTSPAQGEVPAVTEAVPVASAAPPSTVAETPPAPAPRAPLPSEFSQPEHEVLYQQDPTLKRSLARIWGRSDLSEVQKAVQMATKVAEARTNPRISPEQTQTQLAREGRYEELGYSVLEQDNVKEAQAQYERAVSDILADALGYDPADPEFLGMTPENFAERAVKESPIARTHLSALTAELTAAHQEQVKTLTTEHETALRDAEKRWKEETAAAVAEAVAKANAGRPNPPRAGLPAVGTAPYQIPENRADQVRATRGLFSSAYRAIAEAREQ